MKRYSPDYEYDTGPKMSEDTSGGWVDYDEATAEIERLESKIEAKDAAIRIVQEERDNREKYWRDWNGRAANRAALLEGEIQGLKERCDERDAEIEQLQKCCTRRGARMQKMREWMAAKDTSPAGGENWRWFTEDYPEAKDWFDEDGVPK